MQFQTAGRNAYSRICQYFHYSISATLVINGSLTLGMMLAVQFITGQLNGPVSQIVNFMRATQDARISLGQAGRGACHGAEEESVAADAAEMPEKADVEVRNLSFRYEGPGSPWVLRNLDLSIPAGKITAVVGESGSGKTTLLKMLLGYYPPAEGVIYTSEVRGWKE
jgi:ATP-binding cassette, subfamily B, bacterial